MKKMVFIVSTVLVMLVTSRFAVRIIDATVQIDDDIVLLVILLLALNTAIGVLGYRLYRRTTK